MADGENSNEKNDCRERAAPWTHDAQSIGYSVYSVHLVITDSGLGGLSICAHLERALGSTASRSIRLTYVNAWPEEGRGYNSLPDAPSRARVFDRALRSMIGMRPDAIVIACNTLSILYELTEFRRAAPVPVYGIVEAGVALFEEALHAHPGGSLVVLGTRTTVESGVHRDRLVQRGIAPERIAGVSCHGLAAAIEQGPGSEAVGTLIDACARSAGAMAPPGEPLIAGLCCTHYSMVEDRIRAAIAASTGRTVITLDPNTRLVEDLTGRFPVRAASEKVPDQAAGPGRATVEVISKVALSHAQREGIGSLVRQVSPATARALADYRHAPDLF
jgi:glutamate racemase